ncbi:AbrB/MazE/SpoVT family DNA-binding domain-containing protein [Paenibacillus sp. Leaf72]|uniref:AbrB/MazE/SpoVT family DNA-binding domain-containing protein n=1 Tax=Paenibacillus sp. Leaf72 TaxID=1736234 RepID=UPI00070055A2|nr:AbrB/MazE/SpoVT family DNA-binding domain-containing protein [Paenibacillus sp. Leaf72]KQN96771.1 hypothetical protein ASF12_22115 [Paenibacillus sp. Leaf72]
MPVINSQGQITFPSEWKKFMGGIKVGEYIYYYIQQSEQKIIISKNCVTFDARAPFLKNNLITIPHNIRKVCNLQNGDRLTFTYDLIKDTVYIMKAQDTFECEICNEEGNLQGYPCIVCEGKGRFKLETWSNELTRLFRMGYKYGINISIINTNTIHLPDNEVANIFPVIQIESSNFPIEVLEKFQDYYQKRAIRVRGEEESQDF